MITSLPNHGRAKVVKVLAEGYGHKSGQGSNSQLGGVFIIDTGGKVRFAHIAVYAAHYPSPQEIVEAAATLNGQSGSIPG